MRIGHIDINNFRGFEERSFDFDPKMNVVLGNNTTGKTTLLHAVQIALGAYLQELTIVTGCSRNFRPSDQRKMYSQANASWMPIPDKPSVEVDARIVDCLYNLDTKESASQEFPISWLRTSNRNSYRNAGELMDATKLMDSHRRDADKTRVTSVLPLMLSFGAARLGGKYNGAEKTQARASREEKAYKCALDEKVDFKSAFNWIYKFDKELAKGREFEGTDAAFIEAIKTAIPAIKDIEIDTKNSEFNAKIQMATDEEPCWLEYSMMSDGFKAMINIAAAMAYRSILLNGFMGAEAVKKTPGIVMIDEVDLYLHPHWQQHVLADLQTAFPEIQFIVTTHSPFIVQSVESQNVITLDTEANNMVSPSNRGIEEIVIDEMGLGNDMGVRSKKYREKYELAHQYFELVKQGNADPETIAEVRDKLERLEREAHLFHDPAFEAVLMMKRGNL